MLAAVVHRSFISSFIQKSSWRIRPRPWKDNSINLKHPECVKVRGVMFSEKGEPAAGGGLGEVSLTRHTQKGLKC